MKSDNVGEFVCVTCGKHYHMCKNCANTKIPYVAWRATACSPDCYAVSEAINAHYYNRITAKEAKEKFEAANWQKIEHILPDVQEYIVKVMLEAGDESKPTQRRTKAKQPADE